MSNIVHRKKPTKHSLDRMKTRAGISNKKQAENMIKAASRKGMSIDDFPPCELKNYLLTKNSGKRVKVYKGIIYIFNKTSDRALTLYPIPEEYMEDYNKYGKQ